MVVSITRDVTFCGIIRHKVLAYYESQKCTKSASYFLVTFIAGVTMLILTLDINLVLSSRTENNTVLEQAEKSLTANQQSNLR